MTMIMSILNMEVHKNPKNNKLEKIKKKNKVIKVIWSIKIKKI